MRPEDYPPQEPLSEVAQGYHREVMQRGAGIACTEAGYGADPYQRVAVFAPRKPNGTILVAMHGGGWTSGYKEWMAFMAPAFTAAGVLFVSAGYRLAPQHVFPAGFEDAQAAVAWTVANCWRYGGDARRLFVTGHSAGGHYAALLALRNDWQRRRGVAESVVRGALPLSGVFDFRPGSGLSMRPRFLGPEGTGSEAAASPLAHIDATPPPFLLAHGDQDFPHLIRQAEVMEAALRTAGGDVERIVLPGRNHFSAHYAGGEPDGPWVPRALDWLAAH